ncbi:thioredoxin family protein [Mesobacillus zeae]|uniref:Thioredoxin n=1 Tax=Mesobacillus zeae TaxID=1917180 RepID=A0A398BAL6_9BACI|nr:thioredoxin family protein [Mesobacillus zeae]RID84673.1 thioredoxin [Mesobacillus zeae]
MKKMIIFLVIVVGVLAALFFLTKMQNEEKSKDNPYQKTSLRQETVDQLDDPNYQNIIVPGKLDKKIEKGEDVTVYFYSPTCSHCQETTPVVAPLAKEMKVDLLQFNLLEFEDGWNKYGIQETPTIVQYKDGKETNRLIGYQAKATFREWFNENSK